jgi:kynurenine formamidase
MVGNTGTYIDTPFHRYPDGHDLAGLGLARVSNVPGLVVRIAPNAGRAIDADAFEGLDVAGMAVLVHTGWDANWRTDAYFEGFPHLTEAAACLLRDRGAALVGIDSHNIDNTDGGDRPVHTVLLGTGIPIVEHLTRLQDLPDEGFHFFAVPPKITGMGTFPVRAHAIV